MYYATLVGGAIKLAITSQAYISAIWATIWSIRTCFVSFRVDHGVWRNSESIEACGEIKKLSGVWKFFLWIDQWKSWLFYLFILHWVHLFWGMFRGMIWLDELNVALNVLCNFGRRSYKVESFYACFRKLG